MSEGSREEEDMEEEEERKVGEDARAGNVDVLLPPLDFDTEDMLKVLREVRNKNDTTTKSRKTLIQLISKLVKSEIVIVNLCSFSYTLHEGLKVSFLYEVLKLQIVFESCATVRVIGLGRINSIFIKPQYLFIRCIVQS